MKSIGGLLAPLAMCILYGCASSRVGRESASISRPHVVPQNEAARTTRVQSPEIPAPKVIESDPATIRLVSGDSPPVINGALDDLPGADDLPSSPALPPGIAQSSSLSLAELEAIALQNNPTLRQAQAAIDVDQGFYRQAGLYPNPQVGYLNSSASNPSVKQSNGLFLSQEFVTANKIDLAQQAILGEIRQMEWDQEAQRMRVLNDLKIRYYEVLGAQKAMSVATKLVAVSQESLELTERLLNAKNGTRSDVLQAKIQLETAQLALQETEDRTAAAWKQLAAIAGVPSLPATQLEGDLTTEIPELDLETCWQQLLASSPQLGASNSQLDHGWAEYRSQQAQAKPNVTIQSVIDYDRATQATTFSTLVAMPLPIRNRNQGNIDKAAADVRNYQAEIDRVRLVLRDSLADSFWRYQTSKRQAERLKQSIIPKSEEYLKLAMQIYAAGESNFASVLTAQQTYFHSQVAYVEAVTELHKVVAEINGLQLTGGLNPPEIGSAIQMQRGGTGQRQKVLLKELQDRASKQLLPAAQIAQ